MQRFGDTPMPLYEERNLQEELVDRGWLLFFQMHEPLVEETVLCIDGTRLPSEAFDIGDADGYGFLVEVHENQISLHPALYDGSSGPVPTLDLQAHCSVLDQPMERFARQWIRLENG